MTKQSTVTDQLGADPRNTFLTPAEVMLRYGWGRTKGYETLRKRAAGFPPALAGRYRLDTLQAWEDRVLASSGWDGDPTTPAPADAAPQLPARRRPGRPRKDAA